MSFGLELFKYPPRPDDPSFGTGDYVDLSERLLEESLGNINRAVELDFLSFRTGDVTVVLDDSDGFITQTFEEFGPDDRWHLRITREGKAIFTGVLLGLGSISQNSTDRNYEVTAFGGVRILEDTSAEEVKRTFASDVTLDVARASGSTTITVTPALGPVVGGDTLHLTDDALVKADVVVLNAVSDSEFELEAPLAQDFPAGSRVTVNTDSYRFKEIDFLVSELFKEALVPLAELRLSDAFFKLQLPSFVNRNNLLHTRTAGKLLWPGNTITTGLDGRVHITMGGFQDNAISGQGRYSQDPESPDEGWTLEAAANSGQSFVDWSMYRTLAQGPFSIDQGDFGLYIAESRVGSPTWFSGYHVDKVAGESWLYLLESAIGGVRRYESTNGLTWGSPTSWKPSIFSFVGAGSDTNHHYGTMFDPVRGHVWVTASNTGQKQTKVIVESTALFLQDGGSDFALNDGEALLGMVYVPEWDMVVGMTNGLGGSPTTNNKTGPWKIVGYRGAAKMLESAELPAIGINPDEEYEDRGSAFPIGPFYPTASLRVYNGVAYMVFINDGQLNILVSTDQLASFFVAPVIENTNRTWLCAGTDGIGYRFASFDGDRPSQYFSVRPPSKVLIDLAAFEGMSVAEALGELAVLVNALFWLDDHLQGHFVGRDLLLEEAIDLLDVSDRVLEKTIQPVWEDSRQFVEVSGNGFEGEAGTKAFQADSQDVSAELLQNGAQAKALAQAYLGFYSPKREKLITRFEDREDKVFQPLDRMVLDGKRWLVHEVEQNLVEREYEVEALEDLESV